MLGFACIIVERPGVIISSSAVPVILGGTYETGENAILFTLSMCGLCKVKRLFEDITLE